MSDNDEVLDPKKRSFLKNAFLTLGGLAAGAVGLAQLNRYDVLPHTETDIQNINAVNPDVPDDPKHHWGFIIDLAKCDGCESLEPPEDDPTGEKPRCSYACRKSHYFLGAEPPQYWIRVYKVDQVEGVEYIDFPKPCQNCQDAPCKRVCPTGATYQRRDGTILINHDYCIGCRLCMAACPYETRFFWYNDPPDLGPEVEQNNYYPEFAIPHTRGTVVKCDLCIHNAYHSRPPHCVSACPKGALYFGDLNQDAVSNSREVIPLHETLTNRGGYRFKEEEGTEPSVYYLPVVNLDEVNP